LVNIDDLNERWHKSLGVAATCEILNKAFAQQRDIQIEITVRHPMTDISWWYKVTEVDHLADDPDKMDLDLDEGEARDFETALIEIGRIIAKGNWK